MVLFDRYIRELLYRYDCVVIPDFGGFVCSFTPAKIHPVQHRFHPPGKHISFNKMLVMNDGLLAHHMSVGLSITYEEALSRILEVVTSWKNKLKNGETVQIEGVGRFYMDSNSILQFQHDTNLNFLIDSYGLTSFQALPIDRKESLKVVHSVEKSKEERVKTLPVLHKMARYSAAAAMLSILTLTAYKMDLFNQMDLQKISLNPFKTEHPVYEPRQYEEVDMSEEPIIGLKEILNNSEEEVIHYQFDGSGETIKIRLKDPKPSVEMNVGRARFHVVGGCFGVESNAKKLVRKLKRKGFRADMNVTHKGLHVVSYQSFAKEDVAREFLSEIKSSINSQAWLLVK